MDNSGDINLDIAGTAKDYMSLVDLIKAYNNLIATISTVQDLQNDEYVKYWIHIHAEVTDNATSSTPEVSS